MDQSVLRAVRYYSEGASKKLRKTLMFKKSLDWASLGYQSSSALEEDKSSQAIPSLILTDKSKFALFMLLTEGENCSLKCLEKLSGSAADLSKEAGTCL